VVATEDLDASDGGLNFQLNGYSPASPDPTAVWQQFCIGIDPKHETRLGWSNETFPSKQYRWQLHQTVGRSCGVPDPTENTCKGDIYNQHGVIGSFPEMTNRLPAGCKLIHELIDQGDGIVVASRYGFVDAHGRKTNTPPQLITTFSLDGASGDVPAQAQAPVLAFQLNIVGLNGGKHATMRTGAGRIIYEASTPLTAVGRQPQDTAAHGVSTAETSNLVYAELAAQPRTRLVQNFHIPGSHVTTANQGDDGDGDTHRTYDQAPPARQP